MGSLNQGLGVRAGAGIGSGSGAAAMFVASGNESSFNENRWLIPRRYKSGDYLSGASEDFSAAELANQSFDLNLRLENFIADGIIKPVRYEVYFSIQQTSIDSDMEFGIFKSLPSAGASNLSYAFPPYTSSQPFGTTNGLVRLNGNISDNLSAGTICSFGFHNPSGTPANQDIDNLKYWITVYFN